MVCARTILLLLGLPGSLLSACKPALSTQGQLQAVNMVFIKGGTFTMGSDSASIKALVNQYKLPFSYLSPEMPRHTVRLSSFYMDRYEVTNAAFKKFLDANAQWRKENIAASLTNGSYLKTWTNNTYPKGEGNYPVTNVTWYAAMAYARWLGMRLPTEAEWEFAAKNGSNENIAYPWGNEMPDSTKANYSRSKIGHATVTGSYPSNKLGVFDLAGNVWEYCLDAWDDKFYQHSPLENPVAGRDSLNNYLTVKTRRVIRGGSWGGGAINMRTTFRDSHPVTGAGDHVGFRCVKEIEQNKTPL